MKDLKPAWVQELNEIGKRLENVDIRIPSFDEQLEAKETLEQILPGIGQVTLPYVRSVLIALEYAKTHFHRESKKSMLDNIKAGKQISIKYYS